MQNKNKRNYVTWSIRIIQLQNMFYGVIIQSTVYIFTNNSMMFLQNRKRYFNVNTKYSWQRFFYTCLFVFFL